MPDLLDPALRRTVLAVALLNFAYGVIEFGIALRIGSVSLFADSIDFFEDTSVNILMFFALAWRPRTRARVGMLLAGILLIPALAMIWTAIRKLDVPVPPDPAALGLTGFAALAVNVFCAGLLARYRSHAGSVTRAAFLSARNDALANVAIILAGVITAYAWRSIWPDLVVGAGIAYMNIDAAREVFEAARKEHRAAEP
jgi:Co/Zn/Cd efflux system component